MKDTSEALGSVNTNALNSKIFQLMSSRLVLFLLFFQVRWLANSLQLSLLQQNNLSERRISRASIAFVHLRIHKCLGGPEEDRNTTVEKVDVTYVRSVSKPKLTLTTKIMLVFRCEVEVLSSVKDFPST